MLKDLTFRSILLEFDGGTDYSQNDMPVYLPSDVVDDHANQTEVYVIKDEDGIWDYFLNEKNAEEDLERRKKEDPETWDDCWVAEEWLDDEEYDRMEKKRTFVDFYKVFRYASRRD
jgi:hypothetical protein